MNDVLQLMHFRKKAVKYILIHYEIWFSTTNDMHRTSGADVKY